MPERPDWNDRYATGDLPWDTGEPDPCLAAFVGSRRVVPARALDVGCGTGTNALWLAERGFDVVGVDVSPEAIAKAEAKLDGSSAPCRFVALDFLTGEIPGGPFAFVFDRGCFHVFDAAEQRARFAERVMSLLKPEGLWLSLIGSTEGPARDHGPPRRSARDVTAAIEPVMEVLELCDIDFRANVPSPARGWMCVARRRAVPAQPSTQRDEYPATEDLTE